jgi:hypothetical protein
MSVLAIPFSPEPEKFSALVSMCCAHRPWFHDYIYEDPQVRREAVIAYLADAYNNGKLFEVWKQETLVGVILFNEMVPFIDTRAHFIFFDSKLSDKALLCINLMGWAFQQIPVETIRVQLPTYATALLKFLRRSLFFRYECEGRKPSWPSNAPILDEKTAALGSRIHHSTLYKGQWHDALMLSVTKEEFIENMHRIRLREETRGEGVLRDAPGADKEVGDGGQGERMVVGSVAK